MPVQRLARYMDDARVEEARHRPVVVLRTAFAVQQFCAALDVKIASNVPSHDVCAVQLPSGTASWTENYK